MRASRLNFHRRSGALAAGLVPGSLAGLPDITHTQIRVAERTSGEVGLTLDIYGFLFGQFVVESNQTGRDPFLNIQPLPGSPGVPDDSPDAFIGVQATRLGMTLGLELTVPGVAGALRQADQPVSRKYPLVASDTRRTTDSRSRSSGCLEGSSEKSTNSPLNARISWWASAASRSAMARPSRAVAA